MSGDSWRLRLYYAVDAVRSGHEFVVAVGLGLIVRWMPSSTIQLPINEDEAALYESGLRCVRLESNGSPDRHSEASDCGEHRIAPPGALEGGEATVRHAPKSARKATGPPTMAWTRACQVGLAGCIGGGSRWVASHSVGNEDAGDDHSEAEDQEQHRPHISVQWPDSPRRHRRTLPGP